jgi:hypothetical protein
MGSYPLFFPLASFTPNVCLNLPCLAFVIYIAVSRPFFRLERGWTFEHDATACVKLQTILLTRL